MKRLGKLFIITEKNVDRIIDESMGIWIRKLADGHGLILGLSGGIDSAVVARLVQVAGLDLKVLLMPEGEKGMRDDSFVDATAFANQFKISNAVIDIKPICDEILKATPYVTDATETNRHLARINIAPRVRAAMLYRVGQLESRRVIGTDNLCEQVTGYFTKFGDGAYDLNPLMYCTKNEVRILARALGVPEKIIDKKPSAGLFGGQTDEEELGITYADLDMWILDGTCGNPEIDAQIQKKYNASGHKRCMPYAYTGV